MIKWRYKLCYACENGVHYEWVGGDGSIDEYSTEICGCQIESSLQLIKSFIKYKSFYKFSP